MVTSLWVTHVATSLLYSLLVIYSFYVFYISILGGECGKVIWEKCFAYQSTLFSLFRQYILILLWYSHPELLPDNPDLPTHSTPKPKTKNQKRRIKTKKPNKTKKLIKWSKVKKYGYISCQLNTPEHRGSTLKCSWHTQWHSFGENLGKPFLSGYQLQINSWLGAEFCVYLLFSVLGFFSSSLFWSCAVLVCAALVSVSSCVH